MNKELWVKWEPIADLKEQAYYISSFESNTSNTIIFIEKYPADQSSNKTLRVCFKEPIVFYAKIADSLRIVPMHDDPIDYGVEIAKWTFFKVIHSHKIVSLEQSLSSTYRASPLIHFVITEVESETHIIATDDPVASWILND